MSRTARPRRALSCSASAPSEGSSCRQAGHVFASFSSQRRPQAAWTCACNELWREERM